MGVNTLTSIYNSNYGDSFFVLQRVQTITVPAPAFSARSLPQLEQRISWESNDIRSRTRYSRHGRRTDRLKSLPYTDPDRGVLAVYRQC